MLLKPCSVIFQGYRRGDMDHKDHLSPPSSVARLSDSDMSEFDLDDGMSSLAGRSQHVFPFHLIPISLLLLC